MDKKINLTSLATEIQYPSSQYIFVEKSGPFQETAHACWQELHSLCANLNFKKNGAMATFKMHPQMIYRAGFTVVALPNEIPGQLRTEVFEGGKYSKYTYVGPYHNLGEVWGLTMGYVQTQKLNIRDGFFIENYANDPATTPAEGLITELMIPTK